MQSVFVESHFATYTGTKNTVKKDFELTHKNDNIFERSFNASDSAIVNVSDNTIKIPNHFFVSGQALTYDSPLGIKTDAISIASTDAFAVLA